MAYPGFYNGVLVGPGDSLLLAVEKSTNFTANNTEQVYLCTGGVTGITATLPSAASHNKKLMIFKKVDSGIGGITINRSGSDMIDAGTSVTLSILDAIVVLYSFGTGWITVV